MCHADCLARVGDDHPLTPYYSEASDTGEANPMKCSDFNVFAVRFAVAPTIILEAFFRQEILPDCYLQSIIREDFSSLRSSK